jgi:hypothetical protein
MKYKTITIVIAIILTMAIVIGALVSAKAQYKFLAKIEQRCEGTKDNCKSISGYISIYRDTLAITIKGKVEKHPILKEFDYKQETYYDLKSFGCIGFFVVKENCSSAFISVHTTEKGHYTAWYKYSRL